MATTSIETGALPAFSFQTRISFSGSFFVKTRQIKPSPPLPPLKATPHRLEAWVSEDCSNRSGYEDIHGGRIVLSKGKLWIQDARLGENDTAHRLSHDFYGGLVDKEGYRGPSLMSVTEDGIHGAWVYADRSTLEVKYGDRCVAERHLVRPWHIVDKQWFSLNGWEGFMAVKERPGLWALYFDINDDGLRCSKVSTRRMLEVELHRVVL